MALALVLATIGAPSAARAQPPSPAADTRAATIAAEEAAKSLVLKPYEPGKSEFLFKKLEEAFLTGNLNWHPFFSSAYNGGGFTLGAGYATHVSSYNTIDVRGSYTPKGYIRAEAEFIAPRLFDRRGRLSVTGGWREATQVGFYGFGTRNTSNDDRANYSFEQPYRRAPRVPADAAVFWCLAPGSNTSQWQQGPGQGSDPSVDEVYTPDTLPGLGASPTYLHSQGQRLSTGGPRPAIPAAAATTASPFTTSRTLTTSTASARPTTRRSSTSRSCRDLWVLSLHGLAATTDRKGDQQIPFFMQPSLGGGSNLRGFSSWRFRDRHSLLLQAEWRVLVTAFIDMALFYDAGKVTRSRSDLDLDGMK